MLHIIPSKKKHVTILKDVSGIIKPRRMTLLLGPPSSGKTTLLLALSGKLDKSLKVKPFIFNIYGNILSLEINGERKPNIDTDVLFRYLEK